MVKFLVMGLLSFLFGCRQQQESPFQQKDGTWYYHTTPIAQADAKSLRPLSPHYAKDKNRVYYGETYRDGRDYFTTKRSRVFLVEGADPASFTYLSQEYGRDRANAFFKGVRFAVKDAGSFELLEYGFARDRITGYYHQAVVPGSDGGTFAALDAYHAKDRAHVFYCDLEPGTENGPSVRRTVQLKGARGDSFSTLGDGYAADVGQAYYRGRVLTQAASSFRVLSFGYAKSATHVYYRGAPIAGADAETFETLSSPTDTADATDRHATYQQGRRTPPKP